MHTSDLHHLHKRHCLGLSHNCNDCVLARNTLVRINCGNASRRSSQIACQQIAAQCSSNGEEISVSRRQSLGAIAASTFLTGFPRKAFASDGEGESELERKTTEFTLSNGLHFIVLERHTAPIFSCHTYADVGAFQEQDGQTGLAHMLEHEAFKGTTRIGTLNWQQERPLLDAQDEVFYELSDAQRRGDAAAATRLAAQLVDLQQQAGQYAVPNDFGARLTREGAVGLNASTSQDATQFVASMPSNKLELWFALEADRFQDPVFRELYSEKRVVLEERRARVDNAPLGKFLECFHQRAYINNYGRPVIGFQKDIEAFGRQEVQDFFGRHYGPRNLTIAIVGDVDPSQVREYAEKYFGGWKPSTLTSESLAAIPSAISPPEERRFQDYSTAGPLLLKAFYRPPSSSDDAVPLEVIADVLIGGRTARLQRNLVEAGKAYSVGMQSSSPGDKYPGAVLASIRPARGMSLEAAEASLMTELTRLSSDGLTPAELQRIKKAAKLELVEGIRYNSSMAASLCSYHVLNGSWKAILQDLEKVERLTSREVQETAARIFTEDNSFTGYVLPKV